MSIQKDFWYNDEEEEAGEDFRRIKSHVMNEVEGEKKEKYKQLEFDFKDDQVAPI